MEPSSSNARKSRSTEKSIRHKYEDACADLFGAEQKIREKRKKIQELRDRCKAIDSKLRQSEELVQQLYQEGEKWQEQQSADSKRQHEKFNKFLKAKDKEIQNQGAIIAQLSAEMAHLNNQRPESKQDDEYFASKFSNLARSVQSWVFRHFNTSGAIQQPTDFSGDLRITLEKISPDWEDLIRRQKIKVVQAMIVDIIVQYIWGPFLIGMVNEGSDAFRLYQQLEQSCKF